MSPLPADDAFGHRVGLQLAAWRGSRSLSQDALAEQLQVDQSHISRVERGKVQLTLAELLTWADALGLDRRACLEAIESLWAESRPASHSLWAPR